MTRLFGLSTCDTCRKARKTLENAGITVTFQDVRDTPLNTEQIAQFLSEFGEKLVNTRSTTWRNLSDRERQKSPETLLAAHPALMKRPVIESDGRRTLGWSAAIAQQHIGNPR